MVITANIKILFISSFHYQLLLVFVFLSIFLWFLTFAIISSFIQFPAESWDLYGTFAGMVVNPVLMYISSYLVANTVGDSLMRFPPLFPYILLESVETDDCSITNSDY